MSRRYLRRGAARAVLSLWGGAVLTVAGANIRGDGWLREPLRDLATGAACAVIPCAIRWAVRELERAPDAGA